MRQSLGENSPEFRQQVSGNDNLVAGRDIVLHVDCHDREPGVGRPRYTLSNHELWLDLANRGRLVSDSVARVDSNPRKWVTLGLFVASGLAAQVTWIPAIAILGLILIAIANWVRYLGEVAEEERFQKRQHGFIAENRDLLRERTHNP